jgi:hypothetical protein
MTGWKECEDTEHGLVIKVPPDFKVYKADYGFLFRSPNRAAIIFKSVDKDPSEVLANTRERYSTNGSSILGDEAMPSFSPLGGISIYTKSTYSLPTGSSGTQYLHSYLFNIDKTAFSYEVFSTNAYDDLLTEEIFLNTKKK